MEQLKKLKKLISKAHNLRVKKEEIIREIFIIIENTKINLDCETKAENACNLEEAINCYIDYGEYDVNSIIEEIKHQIKKDKE